MVLRTDPRQWVIYDDETVTSAFRAFEANALVMYGAWLQKLAAQLPKSIGENTGIAGKIVEKIGVARKQIQAGLAPNDVTDQMAHSQRLLNALDMWIDNPGSVPQEIVAEAMDELAAALAYLDNRAMEHGTNHPRYTAKLISGEICESCGRLG